MKKKSARAKPGAIPENFKPDERDQNMTLLSKFGQVVRSATGRSGPRVLTVKEAWYLTPNMIRVVFAGPELKGFPEGREGGNCKLLIPNRDEAKDSFAQRLKTGDALVKRTYTVRKFDAATQELTIDFVAHGDEGPASGWATRAKAGRFSALRGQAPRRSCALTRIGILSRLTPRPFRLRLWH